ncbi:Dynamin-like 120 kDa protein, mitochondrial [Hypsibius exemplaris]|uniref:Dynamin-like GTPase OPA1, mitochondrial n=2 Tax=Hypsibius exemplaris TaxID=2072580 RepID=A0A9X6NM65_HYPEX|nr:Dynamin-like 120 kDa protein, mitochondrial [Hypsibius exemplaris]OWA52961.1 Dynamin-like 120 kDa protein, mitochondrial [Hypsibius exemplaris]
MKQMTGVLCASAVGLHSASNHCQITGTQEDVRSTVSWGKVARGMRDRRQRIGLELFNGPFVLPEKRCLRWREIGIDKRSMLGFVRTAFCESESAEGRPHLTGDGDTGLQERLAAVQASIVEEQVHYQQRIFKLEKENQELRRQIVLRQEGHDLKSRKLRRNPIEMFSEILDDLGNLHAEFGTQAMLPQVLVVADPNAGKSSLLEVLLHTRIFPRDGKAQVPVKFTVCDGPYHLAQFNDSDREFDLENPVDLEELRKQFEIRLKTALTDSSVSPLVSLTIWGPGLSNIVLVDVPVAPVIEHEQTTSSSERIREACQSLLQNSQALILCLIDSSRDSEYSKTVELVKDFDPDGRRSIFVLTKTDLVETSLANPDKIRRVTDGSLLPLKAIGYYAALPGRGPRSEPVEDVEKFEENYFRTSKLFSSGALKPEQLSTKNMSRGLAETFWHFVRNSLRYQIDSLKARKAALEKNWKSNFNKDELYETGRMQLLDDAVRLTSVPQSVWENEIEDRLWTAMADYVFDNIYVPAAAGSKDDLKVVGNIRLKDWAGTLLPIKGVEVANQTLYDRFKTLASRNSSAKDKDSIYDNFKQTVVDEAFKLHQWDARAKESLRVMLLSSAEAPYIITPDDWNGAVRFMEQACAERLAAVQKIIGDMLGPSSWEKWMLFRRQTLEHRNRRAVVDKLEKLIMPTEGELTHGTDLSKDEINVVQKTLESQGVKVDPAFIRDTWRYLFLSRFLEQAVSRIGMCGEVSDSEDLNAQPSFKNDYSDVDLFYRIKRMIRISSVALRQQLTAAELGRLEGEVKQILDGLERNPARIKEYFNHPRIGLAEELKKITNVQEKLEDLAKLIEDEGTGSFYGGSRNDDSS